MTFSLKSGVQFLLSKQPFLNRSFQGEPLRKMGLRCPGGVDATAPLQGALNVWAEIQDRNNQELCRRLESLASSVMEETRVTQDVLPSLTVAICPYKVGLGNIKRVGGGYKEELSGPSWDQVVAQMEQLATLQLKTNQEFLARLSQLASQFSGEEPQQIVIPTTVVVQDPSKSPQVFSKRVHSLVQGLATLCENQDTFNGQLRHRVRELGRQPQVAQVEREASSEEKLAAVMKENQELKCSLGTLGHKVSVLTETVLALWEEIKRLNGDTEEALSQINKRLAEDPVLGWETL